MTSCAPTALRGALAALLLSMASQAFAYSGGGSAASDPGSTDPAAASPAPCENGEERDSSGACPVVDESQTTRGFTLFSGASARPQAAAPKAASPTAAAVKEMRTAQSAEAMKCGQSCELNVSFAPGSAKLTADSEAKLIKFADSLREPGLARKRFEIATHTDASGSAEKNKVISQARAEAVKNFLVSHGVASTRLEAKGYGAEGLALPNLPNDPRNRRVEARALN